ncbi:MAG: hypothetical protein ACP5HU_11130 [Phycisphaerae bacterium]
MRFIRRKPKLSIALLVVMAGCGLIVSSQLAAQTDESNNDADKLVVGTYDPAQAFQASPGQKELEEKARDAQAEANQAQQEGDQQKLTQISQQFRMDQQRIIQQFQSDVEEVMPDVAESEGVKVVAVEVTYTAEDVETRDVTEALVEALGEKAEESGNEDAAEETTQPEEMPWFE